MLKEIYTNRKLILHLALRDLKSSTYGSSLGILWLLIEPAAYVLMMWFIFSLAMKFTPPRGLPYVPWILSGIVAWNFISSGISRSVDLFIRYSYIVKKAEINSLVLPAAHVLSTVFMHSLSLGLLLIVVLFHSIHPQLAWIQVFYYIFSISFFLFAVSLLLASVFPFFKDLKKITGIVIQFSFWGTPVFWDIGTIPEKLQWIVRINPLFHVISGYRNIFLYNRSIFNSLGEAFYFWGVTIVLLLVGLYLHKKLRPHFGEVIS